MTEHHDRRGFRNEVLQNHVGGEVRVELVSPLDAANELSPLPEGLGPALFHQGGHGFRLLALAEPLKVIAIGHRMGLQRFPHIGGEGPGEQNEIEGIDNLHPAKKFRLWPNLPVFARPGGLGDRVLKPRLLPLA